MSFSLGLIFRTFAIWGSVKGKLKGKKQAFIPFTLSMIFRQQNFLFCGWNISTAAFITGQTEAPFIK